MAWVKCEWNEEAEEQLAELIAGDRDRILRHIAEGKAELYWVEGKGYQGWLLTRIEKMHQTGELLLHLVAYKGKGIRALFPVIKEVARSSGCVALYSEVPSSLPKVQRLYSILGFKDIERVYMVDV